MPYADPEDQRRFNRRRYAARKARMLAYLGGVCVDCDATEGLEIHHRVPSKKLFSLSSGYSRPWPNIQAELDKCELRCGSHHKAQHTFRHGHSGWVSGCRCSICESGNRRYHATYQRQRRRERRRQAFLHKHGLVMC